MNDSDINEIMVQLTSVVLVDSGLYSGLYVYQFDSVTRNSLTGEYIVDGNVNGRYESPDNTEGEILSIPLLESNNYNVPIGIIVKARAIVTRGTLGLEFDSTPTSGSVTGGVVSSSFSAWNDSTFLPTGWGAFTTLGTATLPNIYDTFTIRVGLPSSNSRKVAVQLETAAYFRINGPPVTPGVCQGSFYVRCSIGSLHWDLGNFPWPLLYNGDLTLGNFGAYRTSKTIVITLAPGITTQSCIVQYQVFFTSIIAYPYADNPAMKFGCCTQVSSITDASDNSNTWLSDTTRGSGSETSCPAITAIAQYP